MLYISGDYHFDHSNIIKYCNRPFDSVEHMNSVIINNHNATVKENDTILFLGDAALKSPWPFFEQMNGKFILLEGNHDRRSSKFPYHMTATVLRQHSKTIYCRHDPGRIISGFDFYVCAHVHEKWIFREFDLDNKKVPVCNVGVDVWNFFPTTLEQIFKEYYKWKNGVKK